MQCVVAMKPQGRPTESHQHGRGEHAGRLVPIQHTLISNAVRTPDNDAESAQRSHQDRRRKRVSRKIGGLPHNHQQHACPPGRLFQVRKAAAA
eukprot:1161529-Pelagomonas_calceolata.AAC.11